MAFVRIPDSTGEFSVDIEKIDWKILYGDRITDLHPNAWGIWLDTVEVDVVVSPIRNRNDLELLLELESKKVVAYVVYSHQNGYEGYFLHAGFNVFQLFTLAQNVSVWLSGNRDKVERSVEKVNLLGDLSKLQEEQSSIVDQIEKIREKDADAFASGWNHQERYRESVRDELDELAGRMKELVEMCCSLLNPTPNIKGTKQSNFV